MTKAKKEYPSKNMQQDRVMSAIAKTTSKYVIRASKLLKETYHTQFSTADR
jgi:hypothetical protein